MSFFYMRFFVLSVMLLPVLAGCESYERPLGATIAAIPDAKQGQDCHLYVGGIGGVPDLTGAQAMRAGGITKLRSAEYSVTGFAGLGHECVNARGE
jgi:hypothetical protein